MKAIFACTTAALFVLLAMAPVAVALHGDGNLSRTFLFEGSLEWKPHSQNDGDGIGGAGWYDPDARNDLCFVRLFGLSLGVGFYYETARLTSNYPNVQVLTVPETGEFLPTTGDLACPDILNPGGSDNQFVGTSEFNVWVSGQVAQSHLLCLDTFDVCLPDAASAEWFMQDCNNAAPGAANWGEGALLFGGGTPVDVGNSRLDELACTGTTYNFTSHLSPQLGNQASLVDPHVDQVVPLGEGTTQVMSCFRMDYDRIPSVPPFTPVAEESESHDNFLVLDPTNTGAWTGALVDHFTTNPTGADAHGPPPRSDSVALAGWYDLGGDNGFPCDEPASTPTEKFKDDSTVVVGQRIGCDVSSNDGSTQEVVCTHTNGDPVMCEEIPGGFLWTVEGRGPPNTVAQLICDTTVVVTCTVLTPGAGGCTAHKLKDAQVGVMKCKVIPGAAPPPAAFASCFDP